MSGWEQSAVSIAVFLPVAGAIVIGLSPAKNDRALRIAAIGFTGAALGVGIAMLFGFDYSSGALQFDVSVPWIAAIGVNYHVGVDGISLALFELTLLLSFLCAIYSYRVIPSPGRTKAFLALMLVLETGMAGTFVAFDLILFFVFWELVLVPMYFLIGVWGSANRAYSALKFFLFTMIGSVFMLLGFVGMYFAATPHTFDIVTLQHIAATAPFARNVQLLIFAGIFVGFAVKVPMWPFHTWLPDAHTDAPTIGSVLLAGVMLKMGAYGFIRIALPILPQAARLWSPWIGILATVAIVYAALCCLAQKDLKRLIAYSSVGHMGFVMLGIATLTQVGINAAIFGMVAHGVITGMLFFEVGSVYDRYHTRQISEIGGGLNLVMPRMGTLFWFTAIASLGLPGLAGFWGEVMSLYSSYTPFDHVALFRTLMVFGGIGTILTAGYLLWTVQRVNLGVAPVVWKEKSLSDVSAIEWVSWAPLIAGIVILGLFPGIVFGVTNDAVTSLMRVFGARDVAMIGALTSLPNQAIDLHAIAPELVMAGTAFVVLFVDLFLRPERKWIAMVLSFIGTAAAFATTLTLIGTRRSTFGGMFVVDNFTVLFQVFFTSVCMVVLLLSYRYFRDARLHQGEYYFLLLCSFLGCMIMPASRDLIMLFISLEMVSAPAFLMTGLRKGDPKSNEAALKFFLISVLSTAVMLYGMSLIYGVTHTTRLDGIALALANGTTGGTNLAKAAVLFVVAGFAFKVSAFPFQFWAPDTYEGAPVPVAAYLSVASKAAGFAGLLQLMFVAFIPLADFWAPIFAIVSLFTMFVGNLVALQQRQVVRLLAYSSIAQAGYILLPFALAGDSASVDRAAFAATVLYLLIYAVTNLGAFAVVTGMSKGATSPMISDFDGLGQRAPALAVAMTTCLISLAGIPILAGFWGKLFIFQAAIDRGGIGIWLAAAMVVNSVISVVYYISIARAMYFEPLREPVHPLRAPALATAVAVTSAAAVLAIGVFPAMLTHFPSVSTLVGR